MPSTTTAGDSTERLRPTISPTTTTKLKSFKPALIPIHEKKAFDPIKLERTSVSKLRHKDGTLSMVRDGPDTATYEFFICIGDQPQLDAGGRRNPDGRGFAAFGRVVRGMDVVRKIQSASADGQKLKPPVKIHSIRRLEAKSRKEG